MRLVHVFPIQRGFAKDSLTYFSAQEVTEGSIVSIPLRSKIVPGLVFQSEAISERKAELRTSDFALKKITAKVPRALFYPAYVTAVLRASEYYATTPGALFAQTIPTALLTDPQKIAVPKKMPKVVSEEVSSEKLLFQGTTTERLEHHKNLVREEFARKKSVFIVVPTISDAERLHTFLSRGISEYVYTLHSALGEKELRTRWNGAVEATHPVVIIATGGFLSLPRFDLGTIIVERENTHSYKSIARPFSDTRVIAEYLAEALRVRIIFADLPLRVESVYRLRDGSAEERAPLRARVVETVPTTLVDMRLEKPENKSERFTVLGKKILEEIRDARTRNENVFLFTVRRGLYPLTVCEDCGNTVLCDVTHTPVILHKGPRGNVFVCHSCGAIRPADERCRFCGSWKLQSLGIGSEKIEEILREQFPDVEIIGIDKDRTKTHREATKVGKKFAESKGAILLGTEMALAYLPEKVGMVGVVSIDSLLSLPEWNAYERVFGILTRLRSVASSAFVVQSRKTESEVLDQALHGGTNDFYRTEIEGRKQFGYPPFATFIKITCEGSEKQVQEDIAEVERMCTAFGWSGRSHVMHMGKRKYVVHGFLRIPRSRWPDPELVRLLKTLPPHITVNVDPESIL